MLAPPMNTSEFVGELSRMRQRIATITDADLRNVRPLYNTVSV
jgi:hypothetical protein